MDLLTRSDLEELATPQASGPHVSLFMPTHRYGGAIEADQLAWKNLVDAAEATLQKELRRSEAEKLLTPARQLQKDTMDWQYMSDGLAMFLQPNSHRTFRVPAPFSTLATVGERPVLGPLLRLLSGDEHFLLLALSQRKIRLFEGSRNSIEKVQLADVPTSLTEVVEPLDPRSDTMARPVATAGRGGPAVFYGHGAGDQHFKSREVTKFLRAVATGLQDLLSNQTAPLILIGVEELVANYRAVNSYTNVLEDAVIHGSDAATPEELHDLAWPLVERKLQSEREAVFARFQELRGTGRVSSDLETVVTAAKEGRVETLFVKADPWCWERAGANSLPVVELGETSEYEVCEKVDAAAVSTLTKSGQIYASSQTTVPDSEVAAIFRY